MSDTEKSQIPEAKNLEAINIHLGYLTEAMKEIKGDVKETKNQMTSLSTSFVTRAEFADVQGLQKDHETRIRSGEKFNDTLTGKIWGIGMTTGTIGSILGLIAEIVISHIWK